MWLCALLWATLAPAAAYKILIFNPKFGISHVTFSGKIADTLAAAGHDVVVYQPTLNDKITLTGSKNASVRFYSKARDLRYTGGFELFTEDTQTLLWLEKSFAKEKETAQLVSAAKSAFCREIMHDEENLAKLRAENFDLGITELFESCGFGVFRRIGLRKYIASFGSSLFPFAAELLGIKTHPSYLPGMLVTATDRMTLWQRVKNYLGYFAEELWLTTMFVRGSEDAIREKVPDFSMNDAIADSAFYFVNTQEHVEYAQPVTHKIVYMGGLGKVQSRPLEQKFRSLFESAKRGVVLVSFGSVAQSAHMRPEMKRAFLDAFAEFPDINFLWKYERDDDDIAAGRHNVFTGKWLPQNDILDHPRLLGFISHGGMNSVIEGATKGVPMICVPVFADQPRNARLLVRRGTALMLEKGDLSKETLVAALQQLVSNPSYRRNAQLLSRMVKATPLTADERVVRYAEFAAQFGDTGTLQTQGRFQSAVQLYNADVIGVLLAVTAGIGALSYWVLRTAFRCVAKRVSGVHKKTEPEPSTPKHATTPPTHNSAVRRRLRT